MGSVVSLVAERNHKKKRGWWRRFRRFALGRFFCVLWAIFALLVAAAGKHTGFSLFFRPRGLLGAAGTKIVRPWLLGAILQLFMAVPGPSHMHGTAATQAGSGLPRQANAAMPWWWSHSNPNPPTWVGWVPGGRWGKAKHAGVFSPFCAPLVSCTDSWQYWHSKMRLTRTYNYFATYLYTAAVAVVTEMLELLRKKIATNIYIRFMRVTITLNQSCAQYPLSWFHSAWGRSLRAKPGSDGLSGR